MLADRAWIQRNLGFDPISTPAPVSTFANAKAAEPTSSLDEHGVDLLRAALGEVLSRGGACVWVGPQGMPGGLDADRRLLLGDGRLVQT